jgi:AcrR family transcriptional regulator
MNKKELVIEAARELFTKYGYKKVSMDEIAKKANVTKKTIYTYFKDKDSMFLYFINEELDKMKSILEEKNKKKIPFIEIVSSNIYDMLTFKKNSLLFSNISKEAKYSNTSQCQKFLKLYDDEIISYLEKQIKDEIEKGTIKMCDAHLTAFIVYKICLVLMFEYDDTIDEKMVTKQVASILKDGLFN